MDAKLLRKLVVSIAGVLVVIALLVGLYLFYLRPYVTQWREARNEIRSRKSRLQNLRKAFANQFNPQDELNTLQEEIKNLRFATAMLQKVKTVGIETSGLPPDLEDPEPEIRRELYRDYLKQVMEVNEDKIKEKLRNAQISPPEIGLYNELKSADEAAYYINRATGLQGLIDAMTRARKPEDVFIIDKLSLLDYTKGKVYREGAVNIMRYPLEMTLDTQSLMSFLYELQEGDSYYYLDGVRIEPRGLTRKSGVQQLKIATTINTTMVFESQVKAQVKAAAAKTATTTVKKAGGGWMAQLAASMQQGMEDEARREKEKKWYQFWKWFKD